MDRDQAQGVRSGPSARRPLYRNRGSPPVAGGHRAQPEDCGRRRGGIELQPRRWDRPTCVGALTLTYPAGSLARAGGRSSPSCSCVLRRRPIAAIGLEPRRSSCPPMLVGSEAPSLPLTLASGLNTNVFPSLDPPHRTPFSRTSVPR